MQSILVPFLLAIDAATQVQERHHSIRLQSKPLLDCILPFSIVIIFHRWLGELGPIQDDFGQGAGCTLSWMSTNCGAHANKQALTFTRWTI